MTPASALIFGSIGTLSDSSELQRCAFNRAFADHGLNWDWDRGSYNRMLRRPGGLARIKAFAATSGARVDARAVYASKVTIFSELVRERGLQARPGVQQILRVARDRGMSVALATTTTRRQVDIVLDALAPTIMPSHFAWIGDISRVSRAKPASDIFETALEQLGLPAEDVLAIEDMPETARAAERTGLRTVGFPGVAARRRDFPNGMLMVDHLSPRLLSMDAALTTAE